MIIEQLFNNDKLTSSEQIIAKFIEKNPRIIINLSLEELSEQCYVSQASIIRLCKKLKTKGFADFKIKLAYELSAFALDKRAIHVDAPIEEDSGIEDIAEMFFNLSHQTLEATFHNLDYKAIEKAAKLLTQSDIIHIYGRGESLIVAEDFHYKLLRIGKESTLENLNGFQEAHCINNSKKFNKAALIISQYCDSKQLHYIIDELITNHVPYVLITAQEKAWPYDRFSYVTLRISCKESRVKIGSFASRIAFTYLLDCLYGRIFSYDYKNNIKNLTLFSQRKAERSYFYNSNEVFEGED